MAIEAIELSPAEIRVLGVLIEKSLAQPAYYPMTLNSITAACNQKSNRHPITALSESEISAAVTLLRRRQLADQADPERRSRSIRFVHKIETRFDWNAAQRALMAELMLRGPQTLGELRNRASRMTHLSSADYTRELLSELESASPVMVVELPREPGRSARRFAHLLGGHRGDHHKEEAVETPGSENSVMAAPKVSAIESRIEKLEEEVANLQASLAGLRDQLRTQSLPHDVSEPRSGESGRPR